MKKRWILIAVFLLTAGLLSQGIVQAGAIVAGFDTNDLGATDDGSWGPVSLGFSANFFGTSYSDLYVNNNGNVTFRASNESYTVTGLSAGYTNSLPIIAPFFADVDTNGVGSGTMKYGSGTYEGHDAYGVTWADVGYYNHRTDKLNSFQLILVSRSDIGVGDFDLIFNYDQIKWEAGDLSGGSHGLGGTSAAVGYSNGTGVSGTYYQFPGSLAAGSFLDSNLETGLIYNSNVGVDGRYVFEARNGDITPSGVPLPTSVMLLGSGLLGLIGFRKKFFG